MGFINWKLSVLFISLMAVTPVMSLEPRCSEFHFLESLLEKVVRMENKMDTVQSDTQGQITLLRNRVGELEAKEMDTEQSLNALEQKATELDGHVRSTEEKVTKLNAELTQSLVSQQELVGQHRTFQANKPVAFLAKLDQPLNNLQQNQIVKFRTVLTNIGDGYSPDTGYFVAPVSGVYMFSVSVMSQPQRREQIELFLVRNGVVVTGAYAFPDNSHDQGATTAIVQVAANDKVWVRVFLPVTNAAIGAWHFSSFTGCLIHQL